jgi:hypothetical protein
MILFLDFDGVLHPFVSRDELSDAENRFFSYLPRLEAVLRDYPSVLIVVSSDWRLGKTLGNLQAWFSPDIKPRIIGKTPLVDAHEHTWKGRRHKEILTWLDANPAYGNEWVALDDVADHFQPNAPLILCDDKFGEVEEAALRKLFSEKLNATR